MSLLDAPTERVTVYPARNGEDPDTGNPRRFPGDPTQPGTEARVNITRPRSETEVGDQGYDTGERMVLTARRFPFGARSVVRWQGRLWDVVDEPIVRAQSPATRHTSAVLVARTAAPR